MKTIRNQKGIALVTTLMLTLISLAVILALLYMVTRGTQASGMNKKYRTALEASYGGAEVVAKAIIPFVLQNYSTPSLLSNLEGVNGFGAIGLKVEDESCLQRKIMYPTASWAADCDAVASPSKLPDMTMQLPAQEGSHFMIYAKIMDTQEGNSDMGGIALEGAGVSEGSNVIVPQHQPFLYKIEVQGQLKDDESVSSDLEVIYAY